MKESSTYKLGRHVSFQMVVSDLALCLRWLIFPCYDALIQRTAALSRHPQISLYWLILPPPPPHRHHHVHVRARWPRSYTHHILSSIYNNHGHELTTPIPRKNMNLRIWQWPTSCTQHGQQRYTEPNCQSLTHYSKKNLAHTWLLRLWSVRGKRDNIIIVIYLEWLNA